jgi:Mrp family chromosome partitioning ATPase
LKERYDIILVDAPPVLGLSDVSVLTPLMDAVVFVVRAGKTRREAVRDALALLRQSEDTWLLGFVLTHVDRAMPPLIQSYFGHDVATYGGNWRNDKSAMEGAAR